MLVKVSLVSTIGLALAAASPMPNSVPATRTIATITTTTATTSSSSSSFSDPDYSSRATASPGPERESFKKAEIGSPIKAALDQPAVTARLNGNDMDAAEPTFTSSAVITVVNRNGVDLTTVHAHGEGSAAYGHAGAGTLEHGKQGVFTVHDGWSGRVALNEAGRPAMTGDESLIEGSFTQQNGEWKGDINVSYVDGFTVPVLCWCNENKKTAGCAKDLFELGVCPEHNGHGSCKNPHRGKEGITEPHDFFRPCFFAGGAYTFDTDSAANSLNGRCPAEMYTCCVGGEECRVLLGQDTASKL